MTSSSEILKQLVAFPTVSRDSNLNLIDFVSSLLANLGINSRLVKSEDGKKANLYAITGPADVPGVMLSGHTDVVPVDGQQWSSNPFELRTEKGLHYGRGSADMKGFIACVLSMLSRLDQSSLITPLHLALSYDEEVGCIGVRRLLHVLDGSTVKPRFCIVGEPTLMQPVVAHKGKTALTVDCHGAECHSSLAPEGLNAIYLATDMITAIRRLQDKIIAEGTHDHDYDISHTTLHTGVIKGGTALNIVPNHCQFVFEIRNLPSDNPKEIVTSLRASAKEIMQQHQKIFPHANIEIEIYNSYPALNTPSDSDIVKFVTDLTGANQLGKTAFGTEAGLFTEQLGVQSIVMGPGSIEQAHKPDEYIAQTELDRCDAFLEKLKRALSG